MGWPRADPSAARPPPGSCAAACSSPRTSATSSCRARSPWLFGAAARTHVPGPPAGARRPALRRRHHRGRGVPRRTGRGPARRAPPRPLAGLAAERPARRWAGVRDLRRLATTLEVEEPTAAFVAELALAAGLVVDDKEDPPSFTVTSAGEDWLELPLSRRWAQLAAAWAGSGRTRGPSAAATSAAPCALRSSRT
ncbi:hypothetical protein NKG05_18785 [Oerskovia sp. M15]